jgi:hypothetical protein
MMSFIRHLKKSKIKSAVLLVIILLTGCEQEQQKTNYVARVNDSYLTAEELAAMVDTNSSTTFFRNEVIRNWINRELLYQQAMKEGILKGKNYKRILDKSEKELAGALLLDKYGQNGKINIEIRDLLIYYKKNRDDFKVDEDSYLLNKIHFSNENRAIEFRSLLLDSDWQKALNVFHNDSTIISSSSNSLMKETDIYPVTLLRVVKRLYPLEISIVITERPGYYTVAQVLNKYAKGSVLPFDIVKSEVEKRYLAERRKLQVENYIKELYSDYEIEVIN